MQQQMGQSQQQGIMHQPPSVISTKDLLYLQDMMSWNLMVLKKAHFYESQCQNQDIANEIRKACEMHQRHYDMILSHVQNQQSQPSQTMGQQMQ
ncbi:hypothetical protein LCL95_11165 [Bacillus timonensis]|nr:hypothetical protein [Bacillus timonensis]